MRELVIDIDPGDAPQELVTRYFLALDALYRSVGGPGLEVGGIEPGLSGRFRVILHPVDTTRSHHEEGADNPR